MKETHGSSVEIRRLQLHEAHLCFDEMKLLYGQLSKEQAALTLLQLQRALAAHSTIVFVAEQHRRLVGTGTLCVAPTIGRTLGFIEAVVVDEDHQSVGIGRSLLQRLLGRARSESCTSVQLTCRPSRDRAHKLYESLGFERRETDLLRLVF